MKIKNNNYNNTDKSISPLPIHYTCGALRYLMKALPLPERFSTWNKVWTNRIHKMWCKYPGMSSIDVAFSNSLHQIYDCISDPSNFWVTGWVSASQFCSINVFCKSLLSKILKFYPKHWHSGTYIKLVFLVSS